MTFRWVRVRSQSGSRAKMGAGSLTEWFAGEQKHTRTAEPVRCPRVRHQPACTYAAEPRTAPRSAPHRYRSYSRRAVLLFVVTAGTYSRVTNQKNSPPPPHH